MAMNYDSLNTWIKKLNNTKPYRMVLKNGNGFYEVVFLYNQYHYSDKLLLRDMDNEIECQKKILNMCNVFEKNFKLLRF